MKCFKYFTIILILIVAVIISYFVGYIRANMRTRLKYTEQTKFFITAISHRLANKDSHLESDLIRIDSQYSANYEGNAFERLAKEFFFEDYNNYEFNYQEF